MAVRRYNSIAFQSLSSNEDLMSDEVTVFSEPVDFIPDSPQPLHDDPETVEPTSATVESLPTLGPTFQAVQILLRLRSPLTDLAVVVVVIAVYEFDVGEV
ncbi:hypothetical protein BGZ47_007171 [Haplosporangium gracile]|nr:hypothetical protein BGZ47_007171 [Haplosporangium gracile]